MDEAIWGVKWGAWGAVALGLVPVAHCLLGNPIPICPHSAAAGRGASGRPAAGRKPDFETEIVCDVFLYHFYLKSIDLSAQVSRDPSEGPNVIPKGVRKQVFPK